MKLISIWSLTILIFVFPSCKDSTKSNQSNKKEQISDSVIHNDKIYSVLISKNGELIFEEYYNGKSKNSLCDVQSLTKGIISVLVGIAIDNGFIESTEEPIEKYFPEKYKSVKDARKREIKIKHLLNQTSGLSWKGYLEHKSWLNSEDPILYVLEKEIENLPGDKYNYNSGATHILSAIISKATGKTTLEFANDFLFNPLNIIDMDWQIRNDGYYDGSGLGLKMRPLDLLKLGQLLGDDGKWGGKKILSQKWIKKLFDEKEKLKTNWGIKNSKHGFCWYKAEFKGDIINYGMGYGGQFILLIPKKELIIVTTHNHDTPDGIDQQIKFLNRNLPKLINEYGS